MPADSSKEKWYRFILKKAKVSEKVEAIRQEGRERFQSFQDYFSMKTIIAIFLSIVTFSIFYREVSVLLLSISYWFYTLIYFGSPVWLYTFQDFVNMIVTIIFFLVIALSFYGFLKLYYFLKIRLQKWRESQ